MMYKKRSKDQFKVKPQALTYNYKYIFTGKHYRALAQYCAALLLACDESPDAQKAFTMMKALLSADNNRFDEEQFRQDVNAYADAWIKENVKD